MKAKVTISRCSNGKIYISIEDVLSRVEFVEVAMTAEAFGNAVTGYSCQDADMEVRGLHNVGKLHVRETRTIKCPLVREYDKNVLEQWLLDNAKEDGWMVNPYLGARGSVERKGDHLTICYSVSKFIDPAAGSAT